MEINMNKMQQSNKVVQKENETLSMNMRDLQKSGMELAANSITHELENEQEAILVQQNMEENISLVMEAQSQFPTIEVTRVAQSTPKQEIVPAKKSWKKQRAEADQLDKVRKITEAHTFKGDLVSYAVQRDVTHMQEAKNNSLTEEVKNGLEAKDIKYMSIEGFLTGYRTDKKKRPLDSAEEQKKNADLTFIADYTSGEMERRLPYLEKFTREMLEVKLSKEMITNEYLENYSAELIALINRMKSFQSMLEDADNAPFFATLEAAEMERLTLRMKQFQVFGDLLKSQLACKCVRMDGSYNTPEEQLTAIQNNKFYREEFAKVTKELGNVEAEEQETVTETIQAGRVQLTREEAISSYSDRLSTQKRKELQQLIDEHGIAYVPGMESMVDALNKYIRESRYSVGYTKERKLLINAREEVLKVSQNTTWTQKEREAINTILEYFKEVTNGTLVVPEGAQVRDCSGQKPQETGTITRGSHRNAIITTAVRWSDQKETPLFSHEPTVNDLKQRMVSNCYMVASVAGLVNINPQLLKECIKENPDGTVTVRLYRKYTPQSEIQRQAESEERERARIKAEKAAEEAVQKMKARLEKGEEEEIKADAIEEDLFDDDMADLDDILREAEEEEIEMQVKARAYRAQVAYEPVYIKMSKEIPRIGGADALSAGALWMQMIEKACAFMGRDGVAGYKSLWYGEGGTFLERLLGVSPEMMDKNKKDELFDRLLNARTQQCVYNTGTGGDVGASDGLNTGHAYTIMGAKVENGQKYVLLRNPYSTMSLQKNEDGTTGRTGRMLDTTSDETYGQFYMEYEEFLQKFQSISCVNLNNIVRNNDVAPNN